MLFVSFETGLAGPQLWLRDLLARTDFIERVDAQVWELENRYRGLAGKFRLYAECRRRVVRCRPQVVYLSHDLSASASLALLFRVLGQRQLLVHSHNSCFQSPHGALRRRCYQWLVRHCARIRVAVSRQAAHAMYGPRESTWRLIQDFIDFERLLALAQSGSGARFRNQAGVHRFACVGRLCEQKNQALAIRAFRAVHAVNPHTRLRLVGTGPDEPALRGLAHALGVADVVEFLGALDPVAPFFAHGVDTLLVPSNYEGQGRIVAEAQFFGASVVLSPGVPETACLWQEGVHRARGLDESEWAASMLELAARPASTDDTRFERALAHPTLSARAGVASLIACLEAASAH